MKRLGLKRIGQLYALPRTSLERRFHAKETAEAVLCRLDQALGRRKEPRVPLLPSPDFVARLPFPEPLITHEGVLAGLDHLTSTLCAKLARAGRGCRRLALWVARADGSSTVIEAGLSAPSREPEHLLRLIEDKVETLDMGFGVDLMSLAALVTETLLPAQTSLTQGNGKAAAEPLIDRLINRLGARAVRRLFPKGSHIPELAQGLKSAFAGPSFWPELSSPKPRRPQLLFSRPEPLTVLAEIPEGPPARFTWRHVTRRVIKAEGPERIAPEWWRSLPSKGMARPSPGGADARKADPLPSPPPFRGRESKAARLLPHRGRGRASLLGVPRRPLPGERAWVSWLVSAWGVRVTALATRYAELDVTTNFTFLRGGSHPEELVATAKALGLDAIAVTDINTLAGVVRGHLAAKEVGIKFIVGARLDLLDAPSLLAFPRDRAAYGRLCRLLTLGQRRTEKGQCTLYLDDVAAHAEGLIFIALPPEDFPPPARVRAGDGRGHRRMAVSRQQPIRAHPDARLRGQGERDFEAQLRRIKTVARRKTPLYLAARHAYRGDDRARIAALADLAARVGIPLVATGGVLYHAPHRRPLQDVLTCIREKCTINDAGLRLEANAERHIKHVTGDGAPVQRP